MQIAESMQDLSCDNSHGILWYSALLPQQRGEIPARNIFHDDVEVRAVFVVFSKLNNIGLFILYDCGCKLPRVSDFVSPRTSLRAFVICQKW